MQERRKTGRRIDETLKIPAKANRILNVVLVGMVLIVLRIWHLSVVQYEEKVEESRKPQRRTVLEPARRGTIRDRFNVPLAINKLQYNVSILYNQIKQIPTVSWDQDAKGKRVKRLMRREYIKALSNVLGEELQMNPERIEDLIHAKAALYNQIPFILKENISEQEYYRLKMLEKDWHGINVQRVPMRYYPKGKIASDIIGYLGAINRQEYEKILNEIKSLNDYVQAIDSGESAAQPPGMETSSQARRRLKDLQEQAYSVSDSIGKAGVEANFDSVLRGFRGKRSYYSDARGNFLRELPGTREPLSGKRLLLTISSELQEYAEQLLVQNEKIRQPYMSRLGGAKRTINADKQPWIKGGAIVAMDPYTGEILAMASHPRFDPNDFVLTGSPEEIKQKRANVLKWFENDVYLAAIWDMQRPLEREEYSRAKGIYLHEELLTWPYYLSRVLAKTTGVRENLLLNGTIQEAVQMQKNYRTIAEFIPFKDAYQLFSYFYNKDGHQTHGKKMGLAEDHLLAEALASHAEEVLHAKGILDKYFERIPHAYDKVLIMDLLHLAVNGDHFSDELLKEVGNQSLTHYKEVSGAWVKVQQVLKTMIKDMFHETNFKKWRQANEKAYLKEKREEEKNLRRYAKPYIDYLDNLENEQFQDFWLVNHLPLLAAFLKGSGCICEGKSCPEGMDDYFNYVEDWYQEIANGAHQHIEWAKDYDVLKNAVQGLSARLAMEYLQTLRSFRELDRPLLGSYRHLRKGQDGIQREKHLAAAFYPKYGYGYGRSQAYRQAATQGSIFKLVTAYEALIQKYNALIGTVQNFDMLNPLNIDDRVTRKGKDIWVGFHADGTPITRHYKGGRMPRSLSSNIGQIDVLSAIERSSNPYFALLAVDFLQSPNDLARAAQQFSFGSKTGIDLPGEIGGNIPNDLTTNRTGVHSFSIGQHTLVVTPLQTSVMLSSLVNGGKILKPKIVDLLVGKEPRRGQELVSGKCQFPHQESLALIGIDFPLFVASDAEQQKSLAKKLPTEVKRQIFLPEEIKRVLVEGMRLVVERTQGEGLSSLSRLYRTAPEAIAAYTSLKSQFIGKTSTAESVENMDLELNEGTNLYTHVWFGGVAYDVDIGHYKDKNEFLFRDAYGKPELVVVVYLRYGGYGKEAAPVAAQIAYKWKEIKNSYPKN
jgi:cell division protein FtsI/penicillin-binding protein 2